MSAPVRVESGMRDAWVFGEGSVVVPALKLARCPRRWDADRHGWVIPDGHLSDVLATFEHRLGVEVDVSAVSR
jgi:hypothetical protein